MTRRQAVARAVGLVKRAGLPIYFSGTRHEPSRPGFAVLLGERGVGVVANGVSADDFERARQAFAAAGWREVYLNAPGLAMQVWPPKEAAASVTPGVPWLPPDVAPRRAPLTGAPLQYHVPELAHMLRAIRRACRMSNGKQVPLNTVKWAADSLNVPYRIEAVDALVALEAALRAKNGRVRAILSPEVERDQEDTEAEIQSLLDYRQERR